MNRCVSFSCCCFCVMTVCKFNWKQVSIVTITITSTSVKPFVFFTKFQYFISLRLSSNNPSLKFDSRIAIRFLTQHKRDNVITSRTELLRFKKYAQDLCDNFFKNLKNFTANRRWLYL